MLSDTISENMSIECLNRTLVVIQNHPHYLHSFNSSLVISVNSFLVSIIFLFASLHVLICFLRIVVDEYCDKIYRHTSHRSRHQKTCKDNPTIKPQSADSTYIDLITHIKRLEEKIDRYHM